MNAFIIIASIAAVVAIGLSLREIVTVLTVQPKEVVLDRYLQREEAQRERNRRNRLGLD